MFTRARIALIVQAAAAALGLGVSRGPVMPTATAAPLKASPPARPRAKRNAPRKRRHSSSWTSNGAQECTRRMRQIAAQTLTPSNGLLIMAAERFHANSHGEMQHFY